MSGGEKLRSVKTLDEILYMEGNISMGGGTLTFPNHLDAISIPSFPAPKIWQSPLTCRGYVLRPQWISETTAMYQTHICYVLFLIHIHQ